MPAILYTSLYNYVLLLVIYNIIELGKYIIASYLGKNMVCSEQASNPKHPVSSLSWLFQCKRRKVDTLGAKTI